MRDLSIGALISIAVGSAAVTVLMDGLYANRQMPTQSEPVSNPINLPKSPPIDEPASPPRHDRTSTTGVASPSTPHESPHFQMTP
jgi:hypothetical protein